jgi:CTP synthase
LKTKPTQHSVRELRGMGIQPDIIGLRADYPIDEGLRDKVSLFCDVEPRAVIPIVTASNIYEVPLLLEETGLGDLVVEMLGLQDQVHPPHLEDWKEAVARMKEEKPPVRIALVGKYVALHDAYMSVRESLIHASLHYGRDVQIDWINSEELEHGRDSSGWQR